MIKKLPRFMVVDDDPINNMICKKVISNTFPNAEVSTFTEPEKGLSYLESTIGNPSGASALLFLDINMPSMNGWEFLEQFERMFPIDKTWLSVYILSSSIDPNDLEKAKANPAISDFIEKPLNEEKLLKILG